MNLREVAIVADSIACLPEGAAEQYGIKILPINFYHGGKIYRDGVDITPSQAYQLFLKEPDSFKTSGVSPGECFEIFRQASGQTRDIVCITLSSKLSAVYNTAKGAGERIKAELPNISVEVIDSQTVAAAEGFIVLAAARAAAAGKSLSEVVKTAEEIRARVNLVAFMDTVRFAYRSGRIPKMAARFGSMLSIKPVFTVSSGVVRLVGAVRSQERGIQRLLKLTRDKVGTNRVHIAVMHAYALDEAKRLKERVSSEFNCAELWLTEFSPVMGYTVGTGTLGLAFYAEP